MSPLKLAKDRKEMKKSFENETRDLLQHLSVYCITIITIISMTLKTKPQKSVILGQKEVRISKKYHTRTHEKKKDEEI